MHVFQFKNSLYDMHSEAFQAAFVDLHLFHPFFLFSLYIKGIVSKIEYSSTNFLFTTSKWTLAPF